MKRHSLVVLSQLGHLYRLIDGQISEMLPSPASGPPGVQRDDARTATEPHVLPQWRAAKRAPAADGPVDGPACAGLAIHSHREPRADGGSIGAASAERDVEPVVAVSGVLVQAQHMRVAGRG